MNISINKKLFSEAVHIAARFSEKRNMTLPALSSILVIAGNGEIKMRATNLEIGADLKVEGEIKSDGVVAIPAAILQQVANSLSNDGSITLEHTGNTVSLSSGTGKSSIKTVLYDDFPSIPFPENQKSRIVISGITIRAF